MLNKVHLIGSLGQDPEIIHTQTGKTIAKLSLATTEKYKDKSGEVKAVTQWHRIQLWDGLAGIAEKYLKKGSKVYIEGKIQYQTYEDKEGIKRTATDIVGQSLQMLSSAQESPAPSNLKDSIKVPVALQPEEVIPLEDAINDLPF
jgi:single-strand DNA-binding protein